MGIAMDRQRQSIRDLPHVTTERALRLVDIAVSLKDEDTEGKALFADAGRRTTASFTQIREPSVKTDLLLKVSEKERNAEADMMPSERRRHVFRDGLSTTSAFMTALRLRERTSAVWNVLTLLGKHQDTEQNLTAEPDDCAYYFIKQAKKSFDEHVEAEADAWYSIGDQLIFRYAQNMGFDYKVRRSALDSYMRQTFTNVESTMVRIADSVNYDEPILEEDTKAHLMVKYQPAFAAILSDKRYSPGFRTDMIRYLPFRACTEEMRIAIGGLASTPGTDAEVSRQLLMWLQFPPPKGAPFLGDPYGMLEKVVRQRADVPKLQMAAMEIFLDQDSQLAKGSEGHSDLKLFERIIDEMWGSTAQPAQPGNSLYAKLARSAKSKGIIEKMIERKGEPLRQMSGLFAALVTQNWGPIDPATIQTGLENAAEVLESAAHSEFCFVFIRRLCNGEYLAQQHSPVLRRVKRQLERMNDPDAAPVVKEIDSRLAELGPMISIADKKTDGSE